MNSSFSRDASPSKNYTIFRAITNFDRTDIDYLNFQQNYSASILTANMLLLTLLAILLISLFFLIIFVALKAKHFLKTTIEKGVVIEDVRPIPEIIPPPKPKRSKVDERLI